ncbi:MAG: TadE/TadG family type IV pilus assembly protein [Raoultibacter sp.]
MFFFTDSACSSHRRATDGQATVEAAFFIPIIFVAMLLLLQPGILLYNQVVMKGAAAEGCRLLATKTGATGASNETYKASILRRLGAVPQQDNFHVHGEQCTWDVQLEGDERVPHARVIIKNQVKPLPLLDTASTLLGLTNAAGNLEQKVEVQMPTQPDWVAQNTLGLDPKAWVQRWS